MTKTTATVHHSQPHDSGAKHVSGVSVYADDILEKHGTLHMAVGLSTIAKGHITKLDLDEVWQSEGVVDVITFENIPGKDDISPAHLGDEPLLSRGEIAFHGQQIFAVLAQTRDQARRAAKRAEISYHEEPPILNIEAARANGGELVVSGAKFERGEVHNRAPHQLKRSFKVGGQEQFYLEGQIAYAIPGEEDEMHIYSSTQNPTEVQHMVAGVLGVSAHKVVVEARRLGGGFGGKETQPTIFAALAAIAAAKHKYPVKFRPDRDDDMVMTGKRHDFLLEYDVGFDADGMIESFDSVLAARAGWSSDLSGPVTDRALLHADNCYYYPNVRLVSEPLRTNTVSNTAFRGFGGPQGVILAERVIDDIAAELGLDPYDVRMRNLYGVRGNLTPYHQEIEDNIAPRIMQELAAKCDYHQRREAIIAHNARDRRFKKGIALLPVKFGISFTATWFNQAGATINIYQDGTVQVNHGGIEMGQGLNIKVAQVVAEEFQIPLDWVTVTATRTDKVPNTSATAASSGSDLNGKAAEDAAHQIKENLRSHFGEETTFTPEGLRTKNGLLPWPQAIKDAYFARVQLFAAGFYKTPEISWDRPSGRGKPFYYFSYGAACSEVTVDRLSGDYEVDRVVILHDVGKSLNPAIDLGQVEGAFIQGMGWLTREELVWDDAGRLRTHAPSTYKIPLASDLPKIFNAELVDWSENIKPTIRRSKAVGEPPFCLAISVFSAIDQAVRAVGDPKAPSTLDAPATPERVLMAIDARDGSY